jgi:hypothetical protein
MSMTKGLLPMIASHSINLLVKVDSKQQQGKEAKKKLKSQLSKKDKLTKKKRDKA